MNDRRPVIEALEDRNLLSTGIALFEVSPPLPRIAVFVPSRPLGLNLFPDGSPRPSLAEEPVVPAFLAHETNPGFGPQQAFSAPGFGPQQAFSALSEHALSEQLPQPSPAPRASLVDFAIRVISEHAARSSDLGPPGPSAVAAPENSAFPPSPTPMSPMAAPFPSSQDLAFLSALDVIHHRSDLDPMHARDSGAKLSSDPSMLESNASTDQTEGITALSGVVAGAGAVLGNNASGSVLATVMSLPARVTSFVDLESNHGSTTQYDALIRDGLLELARESSPALLSNILGPQLVSLGATARTALLKGRISPNLISYPADHSTAPDSQEILALPHAAGLITEALPQDGRLLQEAIDQLLDRLPELDLGQFKDGGPARIVACSLVLFGALVAAFAMRRRLRAKAAGAMVSRQRDSRESDDLMGFPELPGSWSTRVT